MHRILTIVDDYGTELRMLGHQHGYAQLETAKEMLSPLVHGLETCLKILSHEKFGIMVKHQLRKRRTTRDFITFNILTSMALTWQLKWNEVAQGRVQLFTSFCQRISSIFITPLLMTRQAILR